MDSVQLKPKSEKEIFVSTPPPVLFGNGPNVEESSWTAANWLTSRFHFSFAEWSRGPSNFGPLRVMNDDLVQPKRGFGTHPHREMEIFTYVVSGFLTHQDSMKHKETLGAGSIQYMSAGTGVLHSEFNDEDVPCRFIQMWAIPRKRGLPPRYGSAVLSHDQHPRNSLVLLVDDIQRQSDSTAEVFLHQDLRMFVAHIDEEISHTVLPDRMLYFLCIEGDTKFSSGEGTDGDVEIKEKQSLVVQSGTGEIRIAPLEGKKSHLLLIEVSRE